MQKLKKPKGFKSVDCKKCKKHITQYYDVYYFTLDGQNISHEYCQSCFNILWEKQDKKRKREAKKEKD